MKLLLPLIYIYAVCRAKQSKLNNSINRVEQVQVFSRYSTCSSIEASLSLIKYTNDINMQSSNSKLYVNLGFTVSLLRAAVDKQMAKQRTEIS